jgi:segregation and condensation protein B
VNNTNDIQVLPELKQIVGALLFGSKSPLGAAEIRRVLEQTAEIWGEHTRAYAEVSEQDIVAAIQQLRSDMAERKMGIRIQEVAEGYRLENDPVCGPWLRQLLAKGKPTRLSRPALETLAIIAYRQPCMRSEIEAVRGVAVDQILRNLLEMQLIRIVGRSQLPGRPWLFGTTQKFLEHFGLKSLNDLPGIDELRRMEVERSEAKEEERARAGELADEMSSREVAEETPEPGETEAEVGASSAGDGGADGLPERPGDAENNLNDAEAEHEDDEEDDLGDEDDDLDDEEVDDEDDDLDDEDMDDEGEFSDEEESEEKGGAS